MSAARPGQVVVTQGGVQALYLTLLALLEPGDEVLMPDPAWPNFRMIAHLLGARAVPYPLAAEGGFLPRPEDLEPAVEGRSLHTVSAVEQSVLMCGDYRVVEQHSYPIFCDDWGADEELLLIDGCQTYGLGQLNDMLEQSFFDIFGM